MLNNIEEFILENMVINGGRTTLDKIKKLYEERFFISLKDWSLDANGQPKWVCELRKSHQSLKDKGIISGGELEEWQVTHKGKELLSRHLSSVGLFLDEEEETPPPTISSTVNRKIRDTEMSSDLKKVYANKCQICGQRIILGNRQYYSEGHHLKPLGKPHDGPDIHTNLIILCPNHHAEFDGLAIAINPRTMLIEHIDTKNPFNGKPIFLSLHNFEGKYVEYHYKRFLKFKELI